MLKIPHPYWWTGPGGGHSGRKSNDLVIGRWSDPQQSDDDGYDGARGECDWTWRKIWGLCSSWMFIVHNVTSSYLPVLMYSSVNNVYSVNSVFVTKNRTEHVNTHWTACAR